MAREEKDLTGDFLTARWTEVVTYLRGTFCVGNWVLNVVLEAAVVSGFFSICNYPFHGCS